MSPRRKAIRVGNTGPARTAVIKTSEPPMSKTLALRKLDQWQKRQTKLLIERDELAKECWDAGISCAIMASYFGISEQRVYQLKDDRYPRGTRRGGT